MGFQVTEKENTLPNMYWIRKIHKNPTGVRFIVAFKICSTKHISASLSNVFKFIYSQIENVYKNANLLVNYNKFWILQNSNPIIQLLNNMNKKGVPNLLQHITYKTFF